MKMGRRFVRSARVERNPQVAGFLTELDVRMHPADKRPYELLQPLMFYSALYRGVWVVQAGYRTDFASIPPLFWGVLPRDGPYSRAAVLHDAGYDDAVTTMDGQPVHMTKSVADDALLEAMEADQVNNVTSTIISVSVRMFGRKDESDGALRGHR